ncbi:MAG: hypothetical protein Fur0042_24160 [Cyanophyceae cyanobacterium]
MIVRTMGNRFNSVFQGRAAVMGMGGGLWRGIERPWQPLRRSGAGHSGEFPRAGGYVSEWHMGRPRDRAPSTPLPKNLSYSET